jgi:hypothetical protein
MNEHNPFVLNSFTYTYLRISRIMRERSIKYNTNMVKIGLTNELYYLNRKRIQESRNKFILIQNISNRLIDFLNNRKGDCIIGGNKERVLKMLDYQKVKTFR